MGASDIQPIVPRGLITAILASVVLDADLFSGVAVIGADGRYSHGITAGRHHKEHAKYIGATARARRRAARIAECDAKIAMLTTQIAGAQREDDRAAGQAQASLDESVAAVTVTERALRRVAAEHTLAPESADQVEAATRRFEAAARDLEARHRDRERPARPCCPPGTTCSSGPRRVRSPA